MIETTLSIIVSLENVSRDYDDRQFQQWLAERGLNDCAGSALTYIAEKLPVIRKNLEMLVKTPVLVNGE